MVNTQSKPLIRLHCGAPKTGTTSIAFYLYKHEQKIRDSGYFFPHRFVMRSDVDPFHRSLVDSRSPSKEDEGIRAGRRRLLEIFSDDSVRGIIASNESILGEPFEPGCSDFCPHADRVAPLLARLFEGYRVEVSFTIRDYRSFIPSYYVQMVRRGAYQSIDAFANAIDLSTLTWERPVRALEQAFGADKVTVYDYADLAQSPSEFVGKAFTVPLGLSLPAFGPGTQVRNRSFGGLPLHLTRYSNYILSKAVRNQTPASRRRLRRFLIDPLSRILPGKKPHLPVAIADQVDAIFEKDRATLLGPRGSQGDHAL